MKTWCMNSMEGYLSLKSLLSKLRKNFRLSQFTLILKSITSSPWKNYSRHKELFFFLRVRAQKKLKWKNYKGKYRNHFWTSSIHYLAVYGQIVNCRPHNEILRQREIFQEI